MISTIPTKPKPAGRGIAVNLLLASMPDNVILLVRVKPPALQVMHVKLEENIKLVVILMEPKMGLVQEDNLPAPVLPVQPLLFVVCQAVLEFLPPAPLLPAVVLPVLPGFLNQQPLPFHQPPPQPPIHVYRHQQVFPVFVLPTGAH